MHKYKAGQQKLLQVEFRGLQDFGRPIYPRQSFHYSYGLNLAYGGKSTRAVEAKEPKGLIMAPDQATLW